MTDRYHSLTVVLEKDIRNDDAEPIVQAISMIKGVLSVSGNVADLDSHMALDRARHYLSSKLIEVLYPKEAK